MQESPTTPTELGACNLAALPPGLVGAAKARVTDLGDACEAPTCFSAHTILSSGSCGLRLRLKLPPTGHRPQALPCPADPPAPPALRVSPCLSCSAQCHFLKEAFLLPPKADLSTPHPLIYLFFKFPYGDHILCITCHPGMPFVLGCPCCPSPQACEGPVAHLHVPTPSSVPAAPWRCVKELMEHAWCRVGDTGSQGTSRWDSTSSRWAVALPASRGCGCSAPTTSTADVLSPSLLLSIFV